MEWCFGLGSGDGAIGDGSVWLLLVTVGDTSLNRPDL